MPIARVPEAYLNWMVSKHHDLSNKAQEELDRRADQKKRRVILTAHAVDRASQRLMHLWMGTALDDEGIHSWLQRRATQALDSVDEDKRQGSQRIECDGLVFIMEFSTTPPTIKSVWMAGGKDEM